MGHINEGHAAAGRPSILLVTRKWPPAVGGMETWSVELRDALTRNADVETLALPGRDDGGSPGPLGIGSFMLRVLWRALAGSRVDAVVLGDVVLTPLAPAFRVGRSARRVLVAAHGTDVAFHHGRGLKPRLYRLWTVGVRLAARTACDAVVANSAATAELARNLGFRRTTWRPLGVRPSDAEGSVDGNDPEAEAAPDEGGGGSRRLLFTGRLVRRKGAGWFVREVLPKLPNDVVLDVAGTPRDADEIEAVDASPRANRLGPVFGAELAARRRAAAAVVVPNVRGADDGAFEGFGLVAAEAAVDGAVTLAADVDGLHDAVLDGETGFLLPSGDAEAWASRIRDVLCWTAGQRRAFTERSRARARETFTWDGVAETFLAETAPVSTNAQPQHLAATGGSP